MFISINEDTSDYFYCFENSFFPEISLNSEEKEEDIIGTKDANYVNKNEIKETKEMLQSMREINKIEKIHLASIKNKQIFNVSNTQDDNIRNTNSKLGRKRKNSSEDRYHNKFSDDNLLRKCKHVLLNSLLHYINYIIKKKYKGNIGYDNNRKILLKINQRNKVNSNVNFNREFLKKTIKDIFSDTVSSKYIRYSQDHNKKIIKSLLNEEDEEKNKFFNKLFNLTFFDCLKYFRGQENIKELNGMLRLNDTIAKSKTKEYDYDYLDSLQQYIKNFENILFQKKSRNRKKKKTLTLIY
jgi:hypothetical protein